MVETLRSLERALSGAIDDDFESVTDSDGSDGGLTINDAKLADHELDSNSFQYQWVDPLDGVTAEQIRRVASNTTSVITVGRKFDGLPASTDEKFPIGTNYTVHKHHPDKKIKAINDALQETYKDLYDHVIDESIVIDDLGRNSSFERYKRGLISVNANVVAAAAQVDNFWTDGAVLIMEFTPYSDGENNLARLMSKMDASSDNGWELHLITERNGFIQLRFETTYATTDGVWVGEDAIIQTRKRQTIALSWNASDVSNDPVLYHAIEDEPLRRVGIARLTSPVGLIDDDSGNALNWGDNEADAGLFDGVLGGVQMWNLEHSLQEIQGFVDYPPFGPAPNLLAHWPLRNEDIVVAAYDTSGFSNDAVITNNVYASNFDGWINAETPPAVHRTGRAPDELIHGKPPFIVQAEVAGAHELRQHINVQDKAGGQALTHKRWVRADAASSARIGIGIINGAFTLRTFSDYHDGDGKAQLLSVDYTLADGDVDAFLICETAASQTGFFGFGWSYSGRVYQYPLPADIPSPSFVSIQRTEDRPDGDFDPLNAARPISGRIIRVEGKAPFGKLAAWSDTVNLNPPQARLLTIKAEELFWNDLASGSSGDQADSYSDAAARAAARYQDQVVSLRMPHLGAEIGKTWHIEGGELVLERAARFSVV